MAGEAILVVDDNAANLKLARVTLMAEGFHVKTATSAEDALKVLADYRPVLILMDLQMPGMDGLELTRRLKDDPDTRDIIVVALTAYAMRGDEQRARDAGCSGYIAKPIDTRTLGRSVAQYIEEARGTSGAGS